MCRCLPIPETPARSIDDASSFVRVLTHGDLIEEMGKQGGDSEYILT